MKLIAPVNNFPMTMFFLNVHFSFLYMLNHNSIQQIIDIFLHMTENHYYNTLLFVF